MPPSTPGSSRCALPNGQDRARWSRSKRQPVEGSSPVGLCKRERRVVAADRKPEGTTWPGPGLTFRANGARHGGGWPRGEKCFWLRILRALRNTSPVRPGALLRAVWEPRRSTPVFGSAATGRSGSRESRTTRARRSASPPARAGRLRVARTTSLVAYRYRGCGTRGWSDGGWAHSWGRWNRSAYARCRAYGRYNGSSEPHALHE